MIILHSFKQYRVLVVTFLTIIQLDVVLCLIMDLIIFHLWCWIFFHMLVYLFAIFLHKMFLHAILFIFFSFFFICSEFCHTLKWNSHGFTCLHAILIVVHFLVCLFNIRVLLFKLTYFGIHMYVINISPLLLAYSLKIYIYYIWLHWVLAVVQRIFVVVCKLSACHIWG